jgi:hypothetical protein
MNFRDYLELSEEKKLKTEVVKVRGLYYDGYVFTTEVSANKFMKENKEWGLLATKDKDGKVSFSDDAETYIVVKSKDKGRKSK